MKARYKLLAFLIFLVVSISTCLYLNKQMIPSILDEEMEKVSEVIFNFEMPYTRGGYYTDNLYKNDVAELDELYKESDIVIKGIPKTKKQDSQIIQTIVEVKEVLQGSVDVNEITVMEQMKMVEGNRLLIEGGSVFPMMYEKEYILFLKRNKDYTSGNVYRLTSSLYGQFPSKDGLKTYEEEYPTIIEGYGEVGCTKDVLQYDVAFLDLIDITFYEDGTYPMDDSSEIRYQALVTYRDTFKDMYMKFYNELKLQNVIQQE